MKILTSKADVKCSHRGRIGNEPSQSLVTIDGAPVLIEPDPKGRNVSWCPNTSAVTKSCKKTFAPGTGYSKLIKIWNGTEWMPACLDNLTGPTNGVPPVEARYLVHDAGQQWVEEA